MWPPCSLLQMKHSWHAASKSSSRGIPCASDIDATSATCMAPQFSGGSGLLQDLKKYYILGEVLALVDLSLVRLQLPAALRGFLWSAWPHSSW